MSRRPAAAPEEVAGALDRLPRGQVPQVGTADLVGALHRRREGRRRAVAELRAALEHLEAAIEVRHARIAALLAALDARPGPRDGR